MADKCPWKGDPASAAEAAGGVSYEEHLATCPRCQSDAAAHRAIQEAFRGEAQPQLSPFFDHRLLAQLARERRWRRSLRRWKRALQLYWLVAAAASVVIVFTLPWGEGPLIASPVLLATLALGGALPVVILLGALRKDPIDLLFETLDWLS